MSRPNTIFLALLLTAQTACGFVEDRDPGLVDAPGGAPSADPVTNLPDDVQPDSVEVPTPHDEVEMLEPVVLLEGTDPVFAPAPDAEGAQTMSGTFASTTQWDTTSEGGFLRLINQERTSRGKNALKIYWDLEDDARAHSLEMDGAGRIYHNPELGSVTRAGYWSKLGENVGVGGSVDSLHAAFMNSPGHRDNILGDYTHVGIGVYNDGTIWVTVVFMKAAVPGLENTYGPFTDDDFNPHEAAIHKIWKAGITFGCGGQKFCPDRTLTRGEMAAFLTRALGLPPANGDYFDDDNGAFYEASSNAMFESGITVGCGGRNYCGSDNVTRGQMAVFLDRAFDYPSSGRNWFTDDDGRFYEQSANDVAQAGVTHGCGGTRFCGEESLRRDQMAAFLARSLNL